MINFNRFTDSAKWFYTIIASSIILFSCATSNDTEDGKPPIPGCVGEECVEGEIDTIKEAAEKIKTSAQYINFVTNGNKISKELGYAMFRGYERFLVLREMSSVNDIEKKKVGFIGFGVNGNAFDNLNQYRCNNGCTLVAHTNTASPSYATTSNQSYGIFGNPYVSSETDPIGFGSNSNTTLFVMDTPLYSGSSKGYPLSYYNFEQVMIKAREEKISLLVYDYLSYVRIQGTYQSLTGDYNNAIMPTVTIDGKNDVNSVYNVAKIGAAFADYLKADNQNAVVLSTGSLIGTTNKNDPINSISSAYLNNAGSILNASNEYFSLNLLYSPEGQTADFANNKIVFTTGAMLTGNIVQSILYENPNLGKRIAMSMPVYAYSTVPYLNGEKDRDIIYKPHESAILAGSLKDYVFSVPVHKKPDDSIYTAYGNYNEGQIAEINGRVANSMLASQIHTLSVYYNTSYENAIELLKTRYTLKQYGCDFSVTAQQGCVQTTIDSKGSFDTQYGFYNIQVKDFTSALNNSESTKKTMVAYFDEYAKQNGGKIADPDGNIKGSITYPTTGSEQEKFDAITTLYKGNEQHMSKFITTADVVVYDSNNKIIAVNGVTGNNLQKKDSTYKYYDVNGKLVSGTTVVYYDDSGKVIPSNIYGNGIVDGTMIGREKVKSKSGKEYNVMTTSMWSSSVFGNAFKQEPIVAFLNDIKADVASVHDETFETDNEELANLTLSFSKAINFASVRKEKISNAIKNFVKDNTKSDFQAVTLGTASLGFVVGQDETLRKNNSLIVSRFGEINMSDEGTLGFNKESPYGGKESSGYINNVSFGFNVGESGTVYTLSNGSSLSTLSLNSAKEDAFSISSKHYGFIESYKSFNDIFEERENIQGAALKFTASESIQGAILLATSEEDGVEGKNRSYIINAEAKLKKDNYAVKLSSGVLVEEGAMLGSKGTEGLYINQTSTYFASVEGERRIVGDLFVNANFTFGASYVDARDSLITNVSGLTSQAFGFGIAHKNLFDGVLAFNYFEGLKLNSSTTISLFNGEDEGKFNLISTGKERNFELSFAKSLTKNEEIKFGFIHTRDAYNQKGDISNVAVVRFTKQF